MKPIPHTRAAGIALAFTTAAISGVSVFVNGYGAKRIPSATCYTTTKNVVAFAILAVVMLAAQRGDATQRPDHRSRSTVVGLVAVGVVGGGVAFILFFEGLARAASVDAAFIHKTMVVWVLLLAVPFLGERANAFHAGAVALLVAGQAALATNLTTLRANPGTAMVLGATLLWAAEVVVAKRLLAHISPLRLGVARLGIGLPVLFGWLAVTGKLHLLGHLDIAAWGWALLTGLLLAGYVATWFAALARAQAIDVTAALVAGALVTAFLDAGVHGTALRPHAVGLVLLAAGAVLLALAPRTHTQLSARPKVAL